MVAFGVNKGFFNKAYELLEDLISGNKKKCKEFFNKIKEIECERNFTINERFIELAEDIRNQIKNIFLNYIQKKNNNEIKFDELTNKGLLGGQMIGNKQGQIKPDIIVRAVIKNEKIINDRLQSTISQFAFNLIDRGIDYNDYIIKIISSIVSYMKIFLDRFLDYLYKGI